MPVRLAIPLHVTRPDLVRPAHVHALICECLERGHAPTHHHRNDKPFAISPLRTHSDELTAFEIGLLDDGLEDRLLNALRERRGRLSLGHQVAMIADRIETLYRATWDELAERARPRHVFTFQFVTPTVFRSGNASTPLPLPKLVFGHYRSRWMTFAPPSLSPAIAFDDLDLEVIEHDITTSTFPRGARDQVGFTGRAVLSLRAAPAVQTTMDALAAIADYAGTGSGTPQGMGVTRYVAGRPAAGQRRPGVGLTVN